MLYMCMLALLSVNITTCDYNISNDTWQLKIPHYNIYSSIANGNSCDCPQMTVHGTWENITWGKLYEPKKTKVKNNRCIATNCYTVGFTNLSYSQKLIPKTENCLTNLTLYQGIIKDYNVSKIQDQQTKMIKSLPYTITNYNYLISNINDYLYSNVKTCYRVDDYVRCYI